MVTQNDATTLASITVNRLAIRQPLQTLPPLALYVHLPWCIKKCPYCDFNSHEAPAHLGESQYLQALQLDLEAALPDIWGRPIQSIFIGGGTPSLFAPESIEQLLQMIRARTRVAPDVEITMEANPGTFERDRFEGFAKAGVNRLSIGVQSFNDKALKALGRVHDVAQAKAACETASQCYERWNLDLMYGLPSQSLGDCLADIEQALAFRPAHLSLYNLTLEPNTFFAKFPPNLPDDDTIAQMQDEAGARLLSAGLKNYEVSAWARPGFECRHNRNYWEFGDYLGIGAGAHSKLSFHDRIERQIRIRTPMEYQQACLNGGNAISQKTVVPTEQLAFEFMLNALRLTDGVEQALFAQRTGLGLNAIQSPLGLALDKGLLDPNPLRLKASDLGLRFLNDLQALFLSD